MDVAHAEPRLTRALKVAGLTVAAAALVLAAAAAGVFLWLRTYAPLDANAGDFAPGPGVGAAIQPTVGSGGKEVFFPAYRRDRPFDASFTLHNHGRFTVTVEGIEAAAPGRPPSVEAVRLRTTDAVSTTAPVAHTAPFRELTLSPGDTAVLVARFQLACPPGHGRVPPVYADSLRLRYRYLGVFERSETVTLPFAVTLRCVGGPLETP